MGYASAPHADVHIFLLKENISQLAQPWTYGGCFAPVPDSDTIGGTTGDLDSSSQPSRLLSQRLIPVCWAETVPILFKGMSQLGEIEP